MPVQTLRCTDGGLTGAPFRVFHSERVSRCTDAAREHTESVSRYRDSVSRCRERVSRSTDAVRKLSAVERLEADKVKYVKSQRVALTRQAPIIRKPLLCQGLCHSPRQSAPGRVHTPTRHSPCQSAPGQVHSSRWPREQRRDTQRASGSSSCISSSPSCSSFPSCSSSSSPSCSSPSCSSSPCSSSPSCSSSCPFGDLKSEPNRRECASSCQSSAPPPAPPPRVPLHPRDSSAPLCAPPTIAGVTVRRVDVLPPTERRPQRRPLHLLLLPLLPPPRLLPQTAPSPRLPPTKAPPPSGPALKRPALHRSKSDLSDRFSRGSPCASSHTSPRTSSRASSFTSPGASSRASSELQRFFDLCGLDPELLFTRAKSDIVTNLHTSSEEEEQREEQQEEEEQREEEEQEEEQRRERRTERCGISVIERNARVIKWLYSIRRENSATVRPV